MLHLFKHPKKGAKWKISSRQIIWDIIFDNRIKIERVMGSFMRESARFGPQLAKFLKMSHFLKCPLLYSVIPRIKYRVSYLRERPECSEIWDHKKRNWLRFLRTYFSYVPILFFLSSSNPGQPCYLPCGPSSRPMVKYEDTNLFHMHQTKCLGNGVCLGGRLQVYCNCNGVNALGRITLLQ